MTVRLDGDAAAGFDRLPIILAAEAFPTGGPPPGGIPGVADVHVSVGATFIVNGLPPGPFPQVLLPGGNGFTFLVPSGLGGVSVMFQGAVIVTPLPTLGVTLSDVHVFQVL